MYGDKTARDPQQRGWGLFAILLLDEGQKPHKARPLDSGFDCTLLFGGEPALGASHDATVRIDELLEQVDVFVVDVLNVILREDVVAHS